MNHCETCHWWEGEDYGAPGAWVCKPCQNKKLKAGPAGKPDGLSAFADWDTVIATGPRFGCVHWMAQNPTKAEK